MIYLTCRVFQLRRCEILKDFELLKRWYHQMHQIVFCLPETKEIIESIQSGELKNVCLIKIKEFNVNILKLPFWKFDLVFEKKQCYHCCSNDLSDFLRLYECNYWAILSYLRPKRKTHFFWFEHFCFMYIIIVWTNMIGYINIGKFLCFHIWMKVIFMYQNIWLLVFILR